MYIYTVSCYCRGFPDTVTSGGVMGVHTSRQSAIYHYQSIRRDRENRKGIKVCWDITNDKKTLIDLDGNLFDVRECLLIYYDGDHEIRETIKIQRWKI